MSTRIFRLCLLALWAAHLSVAQAAPVRLSSGFGLRKNPISGRVAPHEGVDMPTAFGAPVYAAGDGVVRSAGPRGGYGLMIEIAHPDGTRTRYAHLSRLLVSAGDPVSVSTMIGRAGSTGRSTGPHLHFEYLVDDRPVDPLPYMGSADAAVPRSLSPRHMESEPFQSAYSRRLADGESDMSCPADRLPGGADVTLSPRGCDGKD